MLSLLTSIYVVGGNGVVAVVVDCRYNHVRTVHTGRCKFRPFPQKKFEYTKKVEKMVHTLKAVFEQLLFDSRWAYKQQKIK